MLLQSEASTLDDRISQSGGVRNAGRISLGGCQPNRGQARSTQELERFRQTLDVAFYLLGWGQFEYLVRKEAEERIDGHAQARTFDGHAWRYLKENVKNFPV